MKQHVIIKSIIGGQLQSICYLPDVQKISPDIKHNDVSECTFTVPINDDRLSYLTPTNFAEIIDNNDESVGLFKIVSVTRSSDDTGIWMAVKCKHAIYTLNSFVMFSIHQIDGKMIPSVIRSILETEKEEVGEKKQTDWELGECDWPDLQLNYEFSNCTILDAMMSVPNSFKEAYTWVFNTDIYPFKVSLKRADAEVSCEIRSRKNLVSMSIDTDYDTICNRLYALGSGDGINQTNIKNAEDLESDAKTKNGQYFVQDQDSEKLYGIREAIHVDTGVDNKSMLLLSANKKLEEYKDTEPAITVQAIDLYQKTGLPQDCFLIGSIARIINEDLDYETTARIIEIQKDDLLGEPGNVTLKLNRKIDTNVEFTRSIIMRDTTDKVCAQGSTAIWSHSFADNADRYHPLLVSFRLPENLIYINECFVDLRVENFRSYEQGAAAGGGSVTSTSNSGAQVFSSGAVASEINGSYRGYYNGTLWAAFQPGNCGLGRNTEPPGFWYDSSGQMGRTGPPAFCNGSPVQLSPHFHPHTHLVKISSHNHNITIPRHTHSMTYGIFEVGKSSVDYIMVYPDNDNGIRASIDGDNHIDISKLLNKDPSDPSRAARGVHTIKICPISSAKGLCRITGEIFIQAYIRSKSGQTL